MSMSKVTIYATKLTDLRGVRALLEAARIPSEVRLLSMASTADREAFHALQAEHGQQTLPLLVDQQGLKIGGETELRRRLSLPAESAAVEKALPDRAAWILTMGGVLPFAVGALGLHFGPQGLILELWLHYAALIVSFMAGTHWLDRVRAQRPMHELVWVVLPVLVAWPLLQIPAGLAALGLAALLLALLFQDQLDLRAQRIGKSYLMLRWTASGLAAASLVLGAAAL